MPPPKYVIRRDDRTGSLAILVLLRFAKKSPTSSPETDIDVGRPNIDVQHCQKKIAKLRNYLKYRNG